MICKQKRSKTCCASSLSFSRMVNGNVSRLRLNKQSFTESIHQDSAASLCAMTERPNLSSLVLLAATTSPTASRFHPESPSRPVRKALSLISWRLLRLVKRLRWCRSAGRTSSLDVRGGEPPPSRDRPARGEPASWRTAARPEWRWSSARYAWGQTDEGRLVTHRQTWRTSCRAKSSMWGVTWQLFFVPVLSVWTLSLILFSLSNNLIIISLNWLQTTFCLQSQVSGVEVAPTEVAMNKTNTKGLSPEPVFSLSLLGFCRNTADSVLEDPLPLWIWDSQRFLVSADYTRMET